VHDLKKHEVYYSKHKLFNLDFSGYGLRLNYRAIIQPVQKLQRYSTEHQCLRIFVNVDFNVFHCLFLNKIKYTAVILPLKII